MVEGHDDERSESLPPLEFGYTAFEPTEQRYQPISGAAGSGPRRSLGHPEYELVDLFGRGLPDVVEFDEQVHYWRNLGGGGFDLMRTMRTGPAGVRLSEAGVQLLDANGNGRADLMVVQGDRSGYYPLTFDGEWSEWGFVRYRSAPAINLDAPDVRLIDLDGDGVTDALRTGPQFELYYNHPDEGWRDLEVRERKRSDVFPNVSFDDPRVKLGDMTGDGLQDVVLVHNGRVEYWPYQGYGRWGRRVTMRGSPRFDDAALYPGTGFDPGRLLVGDVDGDGVADLVYITAGHVTVWINQDGNSWSDPFVIHGTPPVTDATAVRLADMLGTGTDGVLWTYDFDTFPDSTYKFLDLTGGIKPYVLDFMDNKMGATTKVTYAPSTRFSLEDAERPETRWRTPLPFPVQVVARVEVIDQISHGKLTTAYRYHHGYWDGVEREFRGFGMVEQRDTETFDNYHAGGTPESAPRFEPVAVKHFSPPLLTRTWFHQGPVDEETGDWRQLDWTTDYWPDDPQVLAHTEAIDTFLQSLPDPRHRRDALRTLRGSRLRTESYALDGTPRENRPYTITEHAYGIREESSPASGAPHRPRIFFPHLLSQRTTQWERGNDPRTQFAFSDDYDAYGEAGRQISIAVPRHRNYRVAGAAGAAYIATIAEVRHAQRDDDDRYLVDRVSGINTFEVPNDGSASVPDFYRDIRGGAIPRRLSGQTFNYYDGESFTGLPLGVLGDFGALVRSESLVITDAILRDAYQDARDPQAPALPAYFHLGGPPGWPSEYPETFREHIPELAGYNFADGSDHRARGYFAHSTRSAFDFQLPSPSHRRGLLVVTRDPLGSETTLIYDTPFHLLPVTVTDPVGLVTHAEYDYHSLRPRAVTDINGNRRVVTFSPLGLVTTVAVMGKEGERAGDTSDDPAARLEYNLHAFARERRPVYVRGIIRQHHATDEAVPSSDRHKTITTVEYSDGFGRLLQTRAQAHDVSFGDPVLGGAILSADQFSSDGDTIGRRRAAGQPNVIVSGWQVYDNKGRVVERYEPFFAVGWDFEPRAESDRRPRVTMFYDAGGRVVRTLNCDGSEQRVIHGFPTSLTNPTDFEPTPWEAFTYDANDLAPLCLGPDGSLLAGAAPAAHAFTPSSIVIDAMGRTIETVVRTRDSYDVGYTCWSSTCKAVEAGASHRDILYGATIGQVSESLDALDRALEGDPTAIAGIVTGALISKFTENSGTPSRGTRSSGGGGGGWTSEPGGTGKAYAGHGEYRHGKRRRGGAGGDDADCARTRDQNSKRYGTGFGTGRLGMAARHESA